MKAWRIAILHVRCLRRGIVSQGVNAEFLIRNSLVIIPELLGIREHVVARLATWEGMRPGEILGLQLCGS